MQIIDPRGKCTSAQCIICFASSSAGLQSSRPMVTFTQVPSSMPSRMPLVASGRLLGGASWLASTALPQASRLQGLKYYLSRQSRSPPLVLELPWVSHVPSETLIQSHPSVSHTNFRFHSFKHFSKATCNCCRHSVVRSPALFIKLNLWTFPDTVPGTRQCCVL